MFYTESKDFTIRELAPGARTQLAFGEKLNISALELEAHSVVPRHRHPHEQMGFVVSGEVEMGIGDKAKVLRKGDAYLVPSDVEHSARTFSAPAVVLDVFSPPREDYR
ncbi:MAG: cupin domain-containing protein [Dehalococcoidia bacterium]|jgi:quercetin dioxygenase-like cupin family protein|nr:cupin domain-containing protein [Dehalococcoidia bacterium]MDP7240897.1 cupin domain-containing protein [Dehalococcoidia bacterium]